MRDLRAKRWVWASLVSILLLTAACGSSDDGSDGETEPPASETDQEPGSEAPEPTEASTSEAMETIPISITTLNFPSLVVAIPPIIKDQGFDTANGLDLSIEPFGDIGAFYAAQTNGSVDAGVGGVTVYQNLSNQGADMQIVATYVGLDGMLVITGDPNIQSIEDLRGKTIAATVASAEYQILAIYALSQGLDLENDATVVNASPADVRTQLQAGRVDAGMMWEPGAALALGDNPDYRIIFNGADAWDELTGESGWELVWAMQRSFLEEHPEAADRFIAALQDAAEWLYANPDEAAALMEEASGMPADAFKEVLDQGRVDYNIQPAWEADIRASLLTHFEQAVESGFLDSMPPDDIIYDPNS